MWLCRNLVDMEVLKQKQAAGKEALEQEKEAHRSSIAAIEATMRELEGSNATLQVKPMLTH